MAEEEKKTEKPDLKDLHEELKAGTDLSSPDEKDLHELNQSRKERLAQVHKIKQLYEHAQSLLGEITVGKNQLESIPEEELSARDTERKHRLRKVETLKEIYDNASEMLTEIEKGHIQLNPVSEEEKKEHEAQKIERAKVFEEATKHLKQFGTVLTEISEGTAKLTPIDASEKEELEEDKIARMEMFKKATQYLTMFGEMLGEIESGKEQLKKIEKEDLEAYERSKQFRLKDLIKIKHKVEVASGLVDEIAKRLELNPEAAENFKFELLNRFEVANSYLRKVQSDAASKLEEITNLEGKMKHVKAVFDELKTAKLAPVDEADKEAHKKAKTERAKELQEVENQILAKFDVTATLIKEIQAAPALKKVSEEEVAAYQEAKNNRNAELVRLKGHLDVAEAMVKKVKEGIELTKVAPADKEAIEENRKERLAEISVLKNKLDVMEEFMQRLGTIGFDLTHVGEADLAEQKIAKEVRLKEIRELQRVLKEKNIPLDE